MDSRKRPVSVTLLASLYLVVGAVGFTFHLREILARHAFHADDLLVELTEIIALVCGVFLLRGRNWARWLAVAWMVLHVAISVFGLVSALVVHAIFCAVIAWILFSTTAASYFRAPETEAR